MVNDIIRGISKTLGTNFSGVKIYSEAIKQGFKEPCFFILTLEGSETPLLGNRAKRNYSFDVHYFPVNSHSEMQDVAERLYIVLRQFSLLNGDMMRSVNVKHEVVDGVLHFMFEVKPIVYYRNETGDIMQTLTEQLGLKGDL